MQELISIPSTSLLVIAAQQLGTERTPSPSVQEPRARTRDGGLSPLGSGPWMGAKLCRFGPQLGVLSSLGSELWTGLLQALFGEDTSHQNQPQLSWGWSC